MNRNKLNLPTILENKEEEDKKMATYEDIQTFTPGPPSATKKDDLIPSRNENMNNFNSEQNTKLSSHLRPESANSKM